MAIMSMTGFGRWETRVSGHTVIIEIRTVNHRFFEASMRLPRLLAPHEHQARDLLQESLVRGRVNLNVEFEQGGSEGELVPDRTKVAGYVRLAREIAKRHKVGGELDINTLMRFPDVLRRKSSELTAEQAWPVVEKGISKALKGVLQMRRREGRALTVDMRKRLAAIRSAVGRVEKQMPRRVEEGRRELRKRVDKVLNGARIDESRIASEIAILADRLDTTEEIVRARSHLDQFLQIIREGGAAGRKQNFLLQELQREVNTIGSKANDSKVAREVVSMKEEVEKLREQVQNVE